MKLSLVAVPCMAVLLAAAPNLRADTVNVSVWEVPAFTSVPAPTNSVYGTAPTFVGTMTNPGGSVFNMNSNGITDYTVTSFLTSGGNPQALLTGNLASLSAMTTPLDTPINCNTSGTPACMTDSLFEFSGPLVLTSALTLTILHDDGFYVANNTLAGLASPFCSFPNPTSAASDSCTIPAGVYSQIDVFYAEVDGAPAVFGTLAGTPQLHRRTASSRTEQHSSLRNGSAGSGRAPSPSSVFVNQPLRW